MSLTTCTEKVSKELDIPKERVMKIYKAYWFFIKQKIEALPLLEDINEESFSKLRCNFNIPKLGKLNCTYERFLNVKHRYKILKEKGRYVKDKED